MLVGAHLIESEHIHILIQLRLGGLLALLLLLGQDVKLILTLHILLRSQTSAQTPARYLAA